MTEKSRSSKRLPRAEREMQMLEAAAQLFGQKGFAATSMDDIAAACGITKPMLYAYFGSKDGLYAAMINRAGQHLVGSVVGVIREADPLTRLRHAIAVFMQFVDKHRDSWRMVFAGVSVDGAGGDIARYRQQMLDAATLTLSQLGPAALAAKRAQQIVAPFAHSLLGAAEAGANWWVSTPGVTLDDAQRMADQVLLAIVEVVKRELQAAA